MNPFSSTKNDPPATNPPTTEHPPSRFGPGAEQDRYAMHFGISTDGLERIKKAASYKGTGAEQDRYGAHFHLDNEKVMKATQSLLNAKGAGAEQDRYEGHFGLGADGWARAKKLAAMKGEGAEQSSNSAQDRYGSHFSFDRNAVEKTAKSIQEGVKDATQKK
ncbi:hypothetical protein BU26DRAFT_436940 [Trematosphaeria pertusa]|uniref:Uncharacterized protein n=1 Tax=Trematosphaeria pertusa TaxID=390896 RepID=A0A6A6I0T6_9PLEO|nr:uncharacterized protein BU26DRAFT_436940 [Trematosphaeria pertusa]KAF2243513.1 hypothetical protein BU26DRAFT_436940 [Trematosphaeria pertusa]